MMPFAFPALWLRLLPGLLAAGVLVAGCSKQPSPTAPGTAAEAEAAWTKLLEAAQDTPMPERWRTNPPSAGEFKAFYAADAERALRAAGLARAFYTRFPGHSNALDALGREYTLVEAAVALGSTNALPRLQEIEAELLADRTLPPAERFHLKLQRVQRTMLQQQRTAGAEAALRALETGVGELRREFPDQPEVYVLLLQIAQVSDSARAREIAADVLGAAAAPPTAKEQAAALRKKLEREGTPLALQFTALDGRAVDLAQLKGKVVLVDFWATWCGPCVAELPNVKAAYARLHDRGFEILGISLDTSREALDAFLKKENLGWPQYFDGKGWEGELARRFEITGIPTMWLVDKKGIIRDVNARNNLTAKVEKLLAE